MEEIDLKELFQIFLEKKLHIAVITAVFVAIGVIYTLYFVTPKYEASTTLLLATNSLTNGAYSSDLAAYQQEGITTTEVTINSKLVTTYSVLVKSDTNIRKVISNLGLNCSEQEIRKNVTVTAVSDTEVIKISVKNYDPETAANIANEIAKVFIETIKEFYKIENVYIVDSAEVPITPCNINHPKDVCIFGLVGIVVSALYVFVLTMVDTRIKSTDEIENKLGLPVLVAIPYYDSKEERKERKNRKERIDRERRRR